MQNISARNRPRRYRETARVPVHDEYEQRLFKVSESLWSKGGKIRGENPSLRHSRGALFAVRGKIAYKSYVMRFGMKIMSTVYNLYFLKKSPLEAYQNTNMYTGVFWNSCPNHSSFLQHCSCFSTMDDSLERPQWSHQA